MKNNIWHIAALSLLTPRNSIRLGHRGLSRHQQFSSGFFLSVSRWSMVYCHKPWTLCKPKEKQFKKVRSQDLEGQF